MRAQAYPSMLLINLYKVLFDVLQRSWKLAIDDRLEVGSGCDVVDVMLIDFLKLFEIFGDPCCLVALADRTSQDTPATRYGFRYLQFKRGDNISKYHIYIYVLTV